MLTLRVNNKVLVFNSIDKFNYKITSDGCEVYIKSY